MRAIFSISRICICIVWVYETGVFGAYNWATNPGDGSAENPYQISTAQQLASIGPTAALLDKYFVLTADIDMASYSFTNSPIAPDTNQSDSGYTGENQFSGSLDGKGHVIRNLTISRSGASYNIGLIGLTTSSWQVNNLGLENISINTGHSSYYIGGLVGRGFSGNVSACYVAGSITGGDASSYMGGLAGSVSATNLSNCYVMCSVANGTSSSLTGGAIGQLSAPTGRIEKCYSTGLVSGPAATTIGGFAGRLLSGALANDCYFLITAGPDNGIGSPKTAAQLRKVTTYTNWVFVDAESGPGGLWRMRSDLPDYPYLAWEFMKTDFYADFKIDLRDFVVFSQSWKTNSNSFDYNWLCDLNNNSAIGLGDLRPFCEDWLIAY